MHELKKIWAFGIPYLRPYRFRFVLGIALSIFFGVSNGLFVLSINTLFNRLTPTSAQTPPVAQLESPPAVEAVSFDKKIKAALKNKGVVIKESFQAASDEWLPRMGKKITWKDGIAALRHILYFNIVQKPITFFTPEMPKKYLPSGTPWL